MGDRFFYTIAMIVAAYAIGSIPFGAIIGRLHGVNLRKVGSGNVGATNVARAIGRKWGILCFVLDTLKGFLPVFLAGMYFFKTTTDASGLSLLNQISWLAVAFGAIIGHVFSFWLKFRGGKGVATSLGALLGFYPYFTWAGLMALGIWIIVVLIWRYVSLGSIVSAAAFPVLLLVVWLGMGWSVGQLWPMLVFSIIIATLVIVRHRSNLARLLAGQENKIGKGISKSS